MIRATKDVIDLVKNKYPLPVLLSKNLVNETLQNPPVFQVYHQHLVWMFEYSALFLLNQETGILHHKDSQGLANDGNQE